MAGKDGFGNDLDDLEFKRWAYGRYLGTFPPSDESHNYAVATHDIQTKTVKLMLDDTEGRASIKQLRAIIPKSTRVYQYHLNKLIQAEKVVERERVFYTC
ncbi:hypothetical protein HYT26_02110 [Candidatus Pacearchaeota archaeon]|nr:hypothetical protein [Candidatus Pacearchaeota archaeon]